MLNLKTCAILLLFFLLLFCQLFSFSILFTHQLFHFLFCQLLCLDFQSLLLFLQFGFFQQSIKAVECSVLDPSRSALRLLLLLFMCAALADRMWIGGYLGRLLFLTGLNSSSMAAMCGLSCTRFLYHGFNKPIKASSFSTGVNGGGAGCLD